MTVLEFIQKLTTLQHQLLGIASLSVMYSTEERVVVTVSLKSTTSVTMFLMNLANSFADHIPRLESDTTLLLGDLKISATSAAPGRCHFTVQYANQ